MQPSGEKILALLVELYAKQMGVTVNSEIEKERGNEIQT